MQFSTREATISDVPEILNLIRELAVFEKSPNAVVVTEKELEESGFGPQPAFKCFVAEQSGEILGMALIYFRFSTWVGRTIHLEDLIVKNAYRGLGIGSALYALVMDYAAKEKVCRVEWVVLDWNQNAIDFYEKTGALVLKDWYLAQMDEAGLKRFIHTQNGSI